MQMSLGFPKKRKRGDRVFKFKNFCEFGYPIEFNGSFQQNLNALVELGRAETGLCGELQSWSFLLELHRHPSVFISLFVIAEVIENSVNRHCRHCTCIGWGGHMICNKRFHFVLPSQKTEPEHVTLGYQGLETSRTSWKFMELQGHLMHGVFHSNGFGHLLCVNGFERGSEFLLGSQIMDFWDRICRGLRARKASLIDTAKKGSMDLRLIHGVAYGNAWFGKWGYRFGCGSYGVTQQMYQKAIEALRGMPLCLLVHHFSISNPEIPIVISRYQMISKNSLLTLSQLFRFLLEMKLRLPLDSRNTSDSHGVFMEPSCRWSAKRIQMATKVIVETLKRAKFRWISRQEVRDAARTYIGDTGLLDFVLKSLGNHVVGKYIVRRGVNPVTKILEYCLEEISNPLICQESLHSVEAKSKPFFQVTRIQLTKDIMNLYKYILIEPRTSIPSSVLTTIMAAVKIILDTKHLVKDYGGELMRKNEVGIHDSVKILCTVEIKDNETGEGNRCPWQPCEVILLRPHSTIGDLKKEAEKIFREIYWGLNNFIALRIKQVKCDDTSTVLGTIELNEVVVIEGKIASKIATDEEIYEGGKNKQMVDCPCGANEDDGERMISCDICDVWQHTRCSCVSDNEETSQIFLCHRCEQEMAILPSLL